MHLKGLHLSYELYEVYNCSLLKNHVALVVDKLRYVGFAPNPCRTPPRASRVSHHPPQVSGLTLAHPCSPTLTRPRPPPSARPIDSGCAGPFLGPGQRGRNGLPRRCRFWVTMHRMVD